MVLGLVFLFEKIQTYNISKNDEKNEKVIFSIISSAD